MALDARSRCSRGDEFEVLPWFCTAPLGHCSKETVENGLADAMWATEPYINTLLMLLTEWAQQDYKMNIKGRKEESSLTIVLHQRSIDLVDSGCSEDFYCFSQLSVALRRQYTEFS